MLTRPGTIRAEEDQFHFPPPNSASDSQSAAAEVVSDACRSRLKSRRILFLMGEQQGDHWLTAQDRFQPLLQIIDNRLRDLGFMIYSPQQIKASIAQAEIDAYFRNDPDAALAASKKLGANIVLRGTISSRAGVNAVVQVNEVAVNIDMTLSGLDGRTVSQVGAHTDSYSGSDTLRTAVTLVNEQAERLVAQLASDYCSQSSIKH
ncbi:MAG: hypothetical protein ABI356_12340 [Steroidobacteraceae bacterium]